MSENQAVVAPVTTPMPRDARIWVAGHRGLVGSALVRRLERDGYSNLLLRTRAELDLEDAVAVRRFAERERPEFVFVAAARVGGILANATRPLDFLRSNLLIELNVLDAAFRGGATKLLFLGSSCIYPRMAEQPIREDALLSGALEPTNEPYAIAKIAGIKLCEAYRRQHGANFIAAMPTNLYGPGDNFDLESSHVLPALLRKMHDAKRSCASAVTLWGTGTPRREFLHVDDCADALLFLMERHEGADIVNVGSGSDVTIRELAETIAEVVGYEGRLEFDATKPDGTPRKLMSNQRLAAMGWASKIGLREGIERTYRWYLEHGAARAEPTAV